MPVHVNFAWIIVVFLSVLSIITAFVVLYCWSQFKKKSDDKANQSDIIEKRFPRLVTFISWWTTTFLFVRPLMFITFLSPLFKTDFQAYKWASRFINISECCLLWPIIWCILIRFWLIYYGLNHSNSIMNKQWLAHLDPSLVSKDFWLRHKTTFGSEKYVTRICIFIW
eukprot:550144_1